MLRISVLIAAVCAAGPLGAATIAADAPADETGQLVPAGVSDAVNRGDARKTASWGTGVQHGGGWKTGPAYAPRLILNSRAERSPARLPEVAKAVLGIISAVGSTDAYGASVMVLTLDGAGVQRIVRISFESGAHSPLRVASLPDDLPRFVRAASLPAGRLPTDASLP